MFLGITYIYIFIKNEMITKCTCSEIEKQKGLRYLNLFNLEFGSLHLVYSDGFENCLGFFFSKN